MPLTPDQAPLRIGLIKGQFSETPIGRPDTDLVRVCLQRLQSRGAQLVEVDCPGLNRANATLITILGPEAAVIHEPLMTLNPAGYAPEIRAQIEGGGTTLAKDYVAARCFQADLSRRAEGLFARVNVLLAPGVPFVAPHEDPVIVDDQDSEILSSGFANVTGHPSLSLPCGKIAGLPVGLQLTGAIGKDERLLSFAAQIAGCCMLDLHPAPRCRSLRKNGGWLHRLHRISAIVRAHQAKARILRVNFLDYEDMSTAVPTSRGRRSLRPQGVKWN